MGFLHILTLTPEDFGICIGSWGVNIPQSERLHESVVKLGI